MSQKYNIANPLFDHVTIRRNRDIYDGLAKKDAIGRYLFKSEAERNGSYAERIRRGAYINLAAPVADLFSAVATGDVNRSGVAGIAGLELMLKNCDRMGNSPDTFFRRVCGQASPIGAHFVLVDMTRTENPAANVREAAELGLIPYFISIPAEDLYSWDFDDDGGLSYIIRRGVRHVSSGPLTSFGEIHTREVWTRTGWQRLESKNGKDFELTGEGAHPCGEVPVVPFLFEEGESPMVGLSVFDDVAENIIQLFNCWSEYDKSLSYSSNPMMIVKGIDPDSIQKMIQASDTAIASEKPDMDAKYVETSGASFAAKLAQIEAAVKYITNVSLRRTRPDSASAVSAESKREDNRELVALMRDFAARMQESERKCWQLAGRWIGLPEDVIEGMQVAYEVRYDSDEVSEGTIQTLIDLVTGKIFSAEFIRGVLYRTNFIQDKLTPEQRAIPFDSVEDRAKIENEARGDSGLSGGVAADVVTRLMGGVR